MANMQLSTTFNAVDRISGPVRNMQGKVSAFGRNAQRSMGGVSQRLRRMRTLITGAAAALATGAIARSVTQFAEAGDEIAKASRQMGLGVEAFQELRFAAQRQGVASDDLQKSFESMNNRLGQLRNGQGSLATQLRNSNPALMEQLQTTEDSEKAFMMLMDAINEETNAADKAALAQAAFGRSGQDLVRMAEAGSAGLADLREEARRYGNIIDDDAAVASEKFQDTLTNIKSSAQALKNAALVPLMNILAPIIENIQEWAAANREVIEQGIRDTIDKIVNAAKTLVRLWDGGLIPSVLAAAAAFKIAMAAITAYNAVTKAGGIAALVAAKAQAIWNASLFANPIGLIVLAVAALIAIIVLVIKNWDVVKAALIAGAQAVGDFFARVWDGIKTAFVAAFNFIKAYYATVADIILTVFAGIAKAVLGVAGKVGDALGFDTSGIDNVIGKIEEVQATVRDASLIGGSNLMGGDDDTAQPAGRGMVSANEGVITSRELSERRSTVDVNIRDGSGRADVRQTGQAPGVTVNTGFQFANLGELGTR